MFGQRPEAITAHKGDCRLTLVASHARHEILSPRATLIILILLHLVFPTQGSGALVQADKPPHSNDSMIFARSFMRLRNRRGQLGVALLKWNACEVTMSLQL